MHADIELDTSSEHKQSLMNCIDEADTAGSPFIQVILPIDRNTVSAQEELTLNNFKAYGYIPGTHTESARLLFGRVRNGVSVVPTAWNVSGETNPLWSDRELQGLAKSIEQSW